MTTFVGQMPALSDLIYPLKTPLVTEEAVWPEEHLPIGPTSVGLIAVGFGGGQGKEGVNLGPAAIIGCGLLEELNYGLNIRLHHDHKIHTYEDMVPEFEADSRNMKCPLSVSIATQALAQQVYEQAGKNRCVLTLGGDHSIAIGTIAGTARATKERLGKDVAVIWVDAHADINTPESSDSGNIHGMPLAMLSSLAQTSPGTPFGWLQSKVHGGKKPIVDLKKLVYIGLRDVDEAEKQTIEQYGIKAYSRVDVHKLGIERVLKDTLEYIGRDTPIHLSFDIDALDPHLAPSTGTPVPGGLTMHEALLIAQSVHRTRNMVGMDLVEVNPLEEPGEEGLGAAQTVACGIEIVRYAFGAASLREDEYRA